MLAKIWLQEGKKKEKLECCSPFSGLSRKLAITKFSEMRTSHLISSPGSS
jgi:hypothetical protein